MFTKRVSAVALAASLFAGQPLLAEEAAVQPVQGAVEVISAAEPEQGDVETIVAVEAVDPAQAQETAAPSGATDTGAPGDATDEQGKAEDSQEMAMAPGMQGPGMKGCRMGKGGMMGMMHGGMGKAAMMDEGKGKRCRTNACADHAGISKKQYRQLMGRLDVLDARMTKIDAMLERLLQR
jgi:hypothetical protein